MSYTSISRFPVHCNRHHMPLYRARVYHMSPFDNSVSYVPFDIAILYHLSLCCNSVPQCTYYKCVSSLPLDNTISVFEIALVRLSETSDYLLGQVNNPLAVILRPSENLQPDFICHSHETPKLEEFMSWL